MHGDEMAESLDEVKRRLQKDFLGHGGIHGLGVNRAKQLVRVYVSDPSEKNHSGVMESLRAKAKPYGIDVVMEERPNLRPAPPSPGSTEESP